MGLGEELVPSTKFQNKTKSTTLPESQCQFLCLRHHSGYSVAEFLGPLILTSSFFFHTSWAYQFRFIVFLDVLFSVFSLFSRSRGSPYM